VEMLLIFSFRVLGVSVVSEELTLLWWYPPLWPIVVGESAFPLSLVSFFVSSSGKDLSSLSPMSLPVYMYVCV
jgi:hypothetical protein